MPLEAAFLDFLEQSITIEPYVSDNKYGEASYGASVSYQCRIEYVNKVIRTAENIERVSTATIFVNTATVINPRSKITLPSGHTPANSPILSVQVQVDETGLTHHTVIYI